MVFHALMSLLLGIIAAGTEPQIRVIDKSPATSPVTVSGIVTPPIEPGASPLPCKAKLSFRNVSRKPIVVSVVNLHVEGECNSGWILTHEEDYFFSDHQFEPGAALTLEPTQRGLQPERVANDPERTPEATAAVRFVQFADGSTWGDQDEGERVLIMRQEHLRNLNELWQVYQTGGDPEFETALMKPSTDDAVSILQAMYRERKNLRIVTDKLEKMLASAESRRKNMTAQ
jgi:hypothetical protein